jgi:hypothetical protein
VVQLELVNSPENSQTVIDPLHAPTRSSQLLADWKASAKFSAVEASPSILTEIYRKGKVAEAYRAFKEIYLEISDQLIDHLKSAETTHSSRQVR